jgi:DNA-binding CsgD family transcriptional regulator
MDERIGQLLARIIDTVGTSPFVEATSRAICAVSDFELSSVILHRADLAPRLIFEDLTSTGHRAGMDNYVRFTHRANPILASKAADGIFRASDFGRGRGEIEAELRDYLVHAPEEELGFRTIGWPSRLEELGLYFRACGGVVEFSLYRERARRSAPVRTLRVLEALRFPLAAAFERHDRLCDEGVRGDPGLAPCLSAREAEVVRLLLAGCSSEAIALRLDISRHTVKDHRKSIFRKLRVGSLAELFALAAQDGGRAPEPSRSRH